MRSLARTAPRAKRGRLCQQFAHLVVGYLVKVGVHLADRFEPAGIVTHTTSSASPRELTARRCGTDRYGHHHPRGLCGPDRAHRGPHAGAGGDAVVDEERPCSDEDRRWTALPVGVLAAAQFLGLAVDHALQRLVGDVQAGDQLVVHHDPATGRDGAHRELFPLRHTELADQKDVERRPETEGHLPADGNAAACKPEHQQVISAVIGRQRLSQDSAGFAAVPEDAPRDHLVTTASIGFRLPRPSSGGRGHSGPWARMCAEADRRAVTDLAGDCRERLTVLPEGATRDRIAGTEARTTMTLAYPPCTAAIHAGRRRDQGTGEGDHGHRVRERRRPSVGEVFAWHTRPGAMTRLVPPWQPMKVVAETASLADGQAVLGLPGGLRWIAQHEPAGYDPPHRFVDALSSRGVRSLPPRVIGRWRHTHDFAEPRGRPTGSRPVDTRARAACGRRSSTGIGSSPTIWPHTGMPPIHRGAQGRDP